MTIKITPNDRGNPPGKLADVELHFTPIEQDCPACQGSGELTVATSGPLAGATHRYQIELPLPHTPGFTLNDMRTVPFETRATLLAMLWAGATPATDRAARTIPIVLATDVIVNVFIC